MNQEKPFFRESNIWRLIGLALLVAAGVFALFAPLDAKGFAWNEHGSVTVPGIIALIGGVMLCFPTMKEAYLTWRGRKPESETDGGQS